MVVAFGSNYAGECNVPSLPIGLTYVEFAAGLAHSVARRSDGAVLAWGANNFSQCDVPALPNGFAYVDIEARGYNAVARIARTDSGPGSHYCFGDGSGNACPCLNSGGSGEGCANGSGAGALLTAGGSASALLDDLIFHGEQLLPNQAALLLAGLNALNGGSGIPFGDGLRCVGGGIVRLDVEFPNGLGACQYGPSLGAIGGWQSGDTRRFQLWYRDPATSPCGSGFNLSNGYEIVFAP
jgi:hypothetical protein